MKFLKQILFIPVIIFLLNSYLFAQSKTPTSLSGNVTICNLVQGGNVQHVSEDGPIVLFITDSASNEKVQLVFSKRVRKKFSYDPDKKLSDHRACVSGKIIEQNGSPAIVIKSEKQIETSDLTSEEK